MHSRISATLVSVAVVALLAAGCGSSDESAPPASRSSAGAAAEGVLPDITVRDVMADADVSLRDFEPSGQPVLYWFWAPH